MLADQLRARRNGRCLTAIATQYRLSATTYRLIERGQRRPQIRTCYRLAGFLGISEREVLRLAGYDLGKDSVGNDPAG